MNSQLIIFDLDGTLVDSKRDLVDSVNATRQWLGRDPLPLELVSSYVGNGAPALVRRALPGVDQAGLKTALRYFLDYYREHMLDQTRLYPGVREGLDRLHSAGIPLAVLTNKPVRFSVTMLERLELDLHFFRVYGGNSFDEKKPHPCGIDALLAECGAARERTWMIGDSSVDVLTARNAQVRACGVTWGFKPESFAEAPPDLLIEEMHLFTGAILGEPRTP